MLGDILFLIVGVMLNVIATIFSAITFAFPSFVQSSVSVVMRYFQYAQGFWPIQGTLQLAGYAFVFLNAMFLVRLALWVLGWVPVFGGQRFNSHAAISSKEARF